MGYNDPWSIWPISDPWLTWPMTDDLRIKIIAYPLHTYCTNGRHVDDVAMRNWKLKRRLTHVNATKLITVKSHVFYRSNAERYWNGSWNLIDLMGQWFTRIHEPCNPSIFVDPFDPWHTDGWPIVKSATKYSLTLYGYSKHAYYKSKMADASHLENKKIALIPIRFDRWPPNLAWWRSVTFLTLSNVKNIELLKIQDGGRTALSLCYVSAMVGSIAT